MDVRYPTFHGDYRVSMIDNAAFVAVCNERSAREIDHAPASRSRSLEKRVTRGDIRGARGDANGGG